MTSTQAPATPERKFERSLLEAILEASPDGIFVVDDQGIILCHNQRLLEVFGIAPGAIAGGEDGDLAGLDDQNLLTQVLPLIHEPEPFLQRVMMLYADPLLEDHCELECRDGRTLERHSRALWGEDQCYVGRVWFFRDITARKRVEHALEQLAQHDPLTGAANRRHFFERAAEELARARRHGDALSLVMLDLDHFKRINDHWGHATGDRVLQAFAAGVRSLLRREDLFGRIGGEEFVVLLPATGLEGALPLAERLRRQTEGLDLEENGERVSVTTSAGVATLGAGDASTDALLQRADEALYAAKRAGRNRSFCQA
ncbi:sensor domain-containing diguanylate cyclase [Halomonas sp. 25-S5]|uniref:GGDEF domain-containing protein n=1 Tax=Halomonas sp. 25-S5 TaxID=2994065 RepID=UPI002468C4D1|nr:sensor domain-containing diguanylate cyclase [Halomonas sp. 25-S5]